MPVDRAIVGRRRSMLRWVGNRHGDDSDLIALKDSNIDGATCSTKLVEEATHGVLRESRDDDVITTTVGVTQITTEVTLAKKT